jgi:hypothetical protein
VFVVLEMTGMVTWRKSQKALVPPAEPLWTWPTSSLDTYHCV